jgi:hypothetical protein
MLTPRMLLVLLFSAFSLSANPFDEAEQAFLAELNSMSGIELAGGPFHAGEQHHFEGESGYFILAPAVSIPTLDQRLSIQTKRIDPTGSASRPRNSTNELPVVASTYQLDPTLSPSDRAEIHQVLAEHGFGGRREEVTVVDLSLVQVRPVIHLPILKVAARRVANGDLTTEAIVLLEAQTWQGIPLYRASFDRTRGDFQLETFRESFIPKPRYEVPLRPPLFAPQTFFAERGLTEKEWAKVLRNFGAIDLPAVEILEGTLSEKTVTLYADSEQPILPRFWVKLETEPASKKHPTANLDRGGWKITQAVEFRAEFPRPGPWWTFLPLLPLPTTPSRDFPNSEIPQPTRREITTLVSRLRGIGQLTSLTSTNSHEIIHARTTHDHWRGYHLEFTRLQNTWRFTSVTEWAN